MNILFIYVNLFEEHTKQQLNFVSVHQVNERYVSVCDSRTRYTDDWRSIKGRFRLVFSITQHTSAQHISWSTVINKKYAKK